MACDKSRASNHYLLPLLKFSAPPRPLSLMLGWHSQRCSKSTSMDSRWLEESWQDCHALIRDSSGSGTSQGRVCGMYCLEEKNLKSQTEMAFDC